MLELSLLYFLFSLLFLACNVHGYRILQSGELTPNGSYFRPFDKGFVGIYGDPSNLQRERINEGAFETPTQELLFEGVSPRQVCPNMVGPFSDGNYYCSAREYGYCDRRSGTCFCNKGYQGIDCSECQGSHYMVGVLCYPKVLCPNDCSGAGTCNYQNGTCSCLPHRRGQHCEEMLCSNLNPLCQACTPTECLLCSPGYYLTLDERVCSSCYDFDPRCAGCTKEQGCTVCADPILTSVRRSGYRASDPRLPIEEDAREFSITLPFGTKSPESFADAENFFVCTSDDKPLKANAKTCVQGPNDESWKCSQYPASHRVCGHFGVFRFAYPNYAVSEVDKFITMSVSRSGGGYGNVTINYFIQHFHTNDSDVIATAPYTTSQTLSFEEGVVERQFLINILDDHVYEANEVFQVVLETPVGGGSIGAQFRTNVTIIDNDFHNVNPKTTIPLQNTITTRGGAPFRLNIQAQSFDGVNKTTGGELFFAVVENDVDMWITSSETSGSSSRIPGQRNALRTVCNVTDLNNGLYSITGVIREQGKYQLRTWFAFHGGLRGQYYYDAFFQNMALERFDRQVNFTWGTGRLIPRGTDFVSIRWSGAIMPYATGYHYFKVEAQDHARLWIDGDILLDHYHGQAANMEPSRSIYLVGNRLVEVFLEYRKVRGAAHARLMWGTPLDSVLHVIPYTQLYGLYEIAQSPVTLIVKADYTYAPYTECTGSGLFRGEALKETSFNVCPRDRFGNLRDDDDEFYSASEIFTSLLTLVNELGSNGQGKTVISPRMVYDHTTHCFVGTYTPEIAGYYRLDIWYQTWFTDAQQPVAGSPFMLTVIPTKAFGPYSDVYNLPDPSFIEAGSCHTFTVVARDMSRNLRLVGGDIFQVYMYQVSVYRDFPGPSFPATSAAGIPTARPSAMPTYSPFLQFQPNLTLTETPDPVVRYGLVTDLDNGNYSCLICPVVAGWYETHILLNGKGVSNQPNRDMDKPASMFAPSGMGSYHGQYVAKSPYSLIVSPSVSSALASTAVGPGLAVATAGVGTWFIVTVRDAWGNILRSSYPTCTVTAVINRSPSATATVVVWNYHNGSYYVRYTPDLAGNNSLSVYVDGVQIAQSPFLVSVADGRTTTQYSFAIGPGLHRGTTGVEQYFEVFARDLDGNRKTSLNDLFVYSVSGANTLADTPLQPCPFPPDPAFPMCNSVDNFLNGGGHYFARYTPYTAGNIIIRVKLVDPTTKVATDLSISNFAAYIHENAANSSTTVITGDKYDQVAGVDSYVNLVLYDAWKNRITTGNNFLELVLLGVAVEWGTIQPWGTTPGLPDAYHYKGFYSGYPNVYGVVFDHFDGSYTVRYNAPKAGQYVMRVALVEPGLNATYFNGTYVGRLFDGNYQPDGIQQAHDYIPINFGTTVSWTGDIGGRPGAQGDRTQSGTYYDMFHSQIEQIIDFDLRANNPKLRNESEVAVVTKFKFREHYWSARWFGLITPKFAERYTFSASLDSSSTVRLFVGGVGTMLNGSQPGDLVFNASYSADASGSYTFSDTKSREFVLEYIHYEGPSFLTLSWQSISEPVGIIPASAFSHWTNISHFNTTIHPAPLSPHHSTAYGSGLTNAMVAAKASFVVYARDEFGNLRQSGGDVPTAFAVGRDGILFRADVTDYGNSTYLMEYVPMTSGSYLLYVTMGCCPAHPNYGIYGEIQMNADLMIAGSPFNLTVASAPVDWERSVSVGRGVVGGVAGTILSFSILYRDVHNNPTSNLLAKGSDLVSVTFYDVRTNLIVVPASISFQDFDQNLTISYNMTQTGAYHLDVSFLKYSNSNSSVAAFGSPHYAVISPNEVYPANTRLVGLGKIQANSQRPSSFVVHLNDIYNNPLQIGGTRLYVRLNGASSFSGALPVIPTCQDLRDGKFLCQYIPLQAGTHELVVKVLTSSFTQPGGTGLIGKYFAYSASFPVLEEAPQGSGINQTNSASESVPDWLRVGHPVWEQLDSVLQFSWPAGFMLPRQPLGDLDGGMDNAIQIPAAGTGAAIVWQGYLVIPLSDTYTFSSITTRLFVSVIIDGQLVYDSSSNGVSVPVALQANAAYEITVRIWTTRSDLYHVPASFSLQWSTENMSPRLVPGFYLYAGATEIAFSPFPVSVAP